MIPKPVNQGVGLVRKAMDKMIAVLRSRNKTKILLLALDLEIDRGFLECPFVSQYGIFCLNFRFAAN